ncbi:MFS transporter [Citricoccus sp. SGAir0253]|uniref:MFS transporter n=1 Tax=Citricoccus sp. SGAir0253 TaxID=2567881 RepID=UPI001FEEC8BE|nr:MFS transporter [Citricoccus sp. SGAir0253]
MPTTSIPAAKPRASVVRTLLGTGAGNAVEWFDWAIYATFASFISTQLFSKSDPSSAFLSTLAIFAVGFVARPFGGFLFGWIGDRVGRKASMTLCVGLASLGSLAIGLTPTYESIGAGASLMLLIARLVQGLAHGGELPSAQTYLSEMAPAARRGYWASLIYVSGTVGILFGTLLGAVLSTALTDPQMQVFGWRIPFLLGALFGLVALVMRYRMEESEVYTTEKKAAVSGTVEPVGADAADTAPSGSTSTGGLLADLGRHWREALQVIGLTVGLTVTYYVWGVSTPAYAINVLGIDPAGALWAGVGANVVFIVALPLWGRLSDTVGRRPVLLASTLGSALVFFPATWFVRDAAWQLGLAMAAVLVFIAGSAAIMPAVYSELFPTSVRTLGIAVPYALCVAAFGGSAAYLQAGFSTWFGENGAVLFGVYTVLLLIVSAVTTWGLRESRGADLHAEGRRQDRSAHPSGTTGGKSAVILSVRPDQD